MKGKHWGKLTKQPGTEYQQVKHGTHGGTPSGSMIPKAYGKEYQHGKVVGSHGGSPSGKFLGQTKGKIRHGSDLSPNRTAGAPSTGHGGGPHKAGGK